jgi:UDP-glucose 4-epimerase
MKKICIFGGSGYIGSFLCQYLKKDFNIICHSKKKITNYQFLKNINSFVYGDITKNKTIDNVIKKKPDKIIYTISSESF